MRNEAPTAVQAAAALPGSSDLGVFYNAGPQAGQPGLGVPGRGLVPSAADVRVVSPAPDAVPTEAAGIERNVRDVRDGISRMDTHGVSSMEFPTVPWRAASGI